jgi:hypothetical protein
MSATPAREKNLESAISIIILVVLIIVAVGIFAKQLDSDMARFGIAATAAELAAAEPKPGTEEMPFSSLIPPGFQALSEIETYGPENLFEKINGKAPMYTDSGFKKLSTQRFASKDDENLAMEVYIYDMAGIRNAFSVYSVQRRAEAQTLPDTPFTYRTSNAIYFVHGRYYIELVGFSESEQLFQAMNEVARSIRKNLTIDDYSEITELTLFPAENLLAETIKLYLTSAFGCEKLTDIFSAKYQINDETITAFLSRRSSPAQAAEVAEQYHKFLLDNGASDVPTDNPQIKLFDYYGTTEIVFATGTFVAGIHEAENREAAQKLVQILLNKLSETTNQK